LREQIGGFSASSEMKIESSGTSRDLISVDFFQLLNFDVDAINSVQLSNHTGYKTIKGQILSEADLADLFDGLTANNLHTTYSHLLTGYVGNDKFLREISKIVKKLREANPNLIYGNSSTLCLSQIAQ
jgi:pyridoxal kinase